MGLFDYIKAELKHRWTEWEYVSPNDCTVVKHCLICGERRVGGESHQWSEWKYIYLDCCDLRRTCKRCGEKEKITVHDWGNWEFENSNSCKQIRICKRCHSIEKKAWEEHEWVKQNKWWRVCSRCGKKTHILSRTFKSFEEEKKRTEFISEDLRRLEFLHGEILSMRAAETEVAFMKEKILDRFTIIDSNIWMNENYDKFFSVLEYLLKKLTCVMLLFQPQFEEIVNIKSKTYWGEERNRRARIALNHIDRFSRMNLIRIEPMNFEFIHPGHVDPLIIQLLILLTRHNKMVSLLTDDIELRIRAREILKSKANGNFAVFDMKDIQAKIDKIFLAIPESF